MKRNRIRRKRQLGALHDLLLKCCPVNRVGCRSIVILAAKMGISSSYIYSWIDKNTVPAKYVKTLVELSEGEVSIQDFHEYVFA